MLVTTGVFEENVVRLIGVVTLAAEPGHGCNLGGSRLEARHSCRAGFILPMQGMSSGLRQMATGFDNVWMSKGEHIPKVILSMPTMQQHLAGEAIFNAVSSINSDRSANYFLKLPSERGCCRGAYYAQNPRLDSA
jgi:hypothetical protein